MFRNSYQHGFLSIFFSCGSKPLAFWETHIKDGYITKYLDDDIKSTVLEIRGNNVSTTYMVCPKGNTVLGIYMPFMVMIVKNLKQYFSFEVTILDDSRTRRRFRVSNFQSTSQVLPLSTAMPIGLNDGWNQIQFDLARFTQKAYKRQFIEVQKVKINANIRLRRIYFTRRLVPDEELPAEFKLFFPLSSKGKKVKGIEKSVKDLVPPETVPEEIKEKSATKLSSSKEQQPEITIPPLSRLTTYSSEKVVVGEIKAPSQEKTSETNVVNVGEELPTLQDKAILEEAVKVDEETSAKTSHEEIGSGEGNRDETSAVEADQEEITVAEAAKEKEPLASEELAEAIEVIAEETPE